MDEPTNDPYGLPNPEAVPVFPPPPAPPAGFPPPPPPPGYSPSAPSAGFPPPPPPAPPAGFPSPPAAPPAGFPPRTGFPPPPAPPAGFPPPPPPPPAPPAGYSPQTGFPPPTPPNGFPPAPAPGGFPAPPSTAGGFPASPAGYGQQQTSFGGGVPSYTAPGPRADFASYGSRVGALLLDALFILLALIPVGVAIFAILSAAPQVPYESTDSFGNTTTSTGPSGGYVLAAVALASLYFLAFALFYFGHLQGRKGQTWGKKMVGIKVVDSTSGQPIGFAKSFGLRWLIPTIINTFCGLFQIVDLLFPLWDSEKQTLHDKFASSYVVKAK